jgi:hypothetical protein
VRWRPKIAVPPGTDGMPQYGDLRFHFDGFVKGLGITVICGLAAAVVVAAAVQALV